MSRSVIEIFEGVAAYIQELRELLEKDGVVNADPLDDRVKKLAAQINALPLEERLTYRAQLDQLQDALKIFELELQERKSLLARELGGVGQHRLANTAYITSNFIDKKTSEQ